MFMDFYGWFGGPPPIRQAEAHAGFNSAQVFAAEVKHHGEITNRWAQATLPMIQNY